MGFNHIAFEVEDVQHCYQQLSTQAVDFSMPPLGFWTDKNSDGDDPWIALLTDPDGTTLVLMQNEVLG